MTTRSLGDPVILRYEDIVLVKSDLQSLLTNSVWITDTLISFYFKYLKKELYTSDEIMFIEPNITQCIKEVKAEEVSLFLDPLGASNPELNLLLFAVSNGTPTGGGFHWSLLAFQKSNRTAFHFDSTLGLNKPSALKLSKNVGYYFDQYQLSSPMFISCSTFQDKSSIDCGVNLLCNANNVAQQLVNGVEFENLLCINKSDINAFRGKLLAIINKLRN